MIEPGVKGACPLGVPPSSLGREGVTIVIPLKGAEGQVSPEQQLDIGEAQFRAATCTKTARTGVEKNERENRSGLPFFPGK